MSTLIEDVRKLNSELYAARYIKKDYAKKEEIWNSIKDNYEILKIAIQVEKDKWNEKDTFFAPAIVECMLLDYENAYVENPNQLSLIEDHYTYANLYQLLVNRIYSNCDLARIVLDGYSNGGFSFLLYTLFNNNLELTEEQKAFATEEAMNKIGTVLYLEKS